MDPEKLTAAVLALTNADGPVQLADCVSAFRRPGPLRLSAQFMRLWCGADFPTAGLQAWANLVGLEFRQAFDFGGGWDVVAAGTSNGGLFDWSAKK